MCRDLAAVQGGDRGAARGARDRLRRPAAAAAPSSTAASSSATAPRSPPPTWSSPRTRRSSPASRSRPASIAAILIDEGHWSSAIREPTGIGVESFAYELLGHPLGRARRRRRRRRPARPAPPRGSRPSPSAARSPARACSPPGSTRRACRLAASLEERRLRDPRLYPGMPAEDRAAGRGAGRGERPHPRLHRALAGDGRPRGRRPPSTTAGCFVRRARTGSRGRGDRAAADPSERCATSRSCISTRRCGPSSRGRVLPGLEVQEIDAAAPHMALRLVAGSFGKGALCPEPGLDPAESAAAGEPARARSSTTSRWQARRVAPGRVLVVTYKACEAAFADIPGVETGHFNAIAGLDAYRDVRLLVVVGRPLPSRCRAGAARRRAVPAPARRAATPPSFAACGCATAAAARCGSMAHADDKAELLRAAICDDEVIQAIGRGRGVNRTRRRSARGARARRRRAAAGARPSSSPGRRCSPTCSSACCSRASPSTARRRRAAASRAVLVTPSRRRRRSSGRDLRDKTL